ncbi:MCE family protein [Streptomyces sp. NPDC054796]
MLTLGVHVKNLVFLVLGVLVLGYLGVTYADLGRYVGVRDYYRVRVELGRTGGLFTNANVTYRGVDVGRVGPLELTSHGVEAELHIDNSAPPVPADLTARVASLSAVGEQYIDLLPRTDEGPYLEDGSVVPRQATTTPEPVTEMLTSVDDLASSVPLDSLRTTVDELGLAFNGQGENLQKLLDTSSEFIEAADEAAPETTELLVDAETVLRTQNEEGEALRSFASGTRELARQLADSDADVERVISDAPGAADQVRGVLNDLDPDVSVLLANLTTTSELLHTRQRGMDELLVRVPEVAAAGASVVSEGKLRMGLAATFFEPLPCTSGYGGTTYRNGLDTSPAPPANTGARCASSPGSGKNVRGSANAPGGGALPAPAVPGSPRARGGAPDDGRGAVGSPGLPGGERSGMSGLLGLGGGR